MRRSLFTRTHRLLPLAAGLALLAGCPDEFPDPAQRDDLAMALLFVEARIFADPNNADDPNVAQDPEVNRRFDDAISTFFNGDEGTGVVWLRRLAAELQLGRSLSTAEQSATLLHVALEPFTSVRGAPAPAARVRLLDRLESRRTSPLRVTLRAVNDAGLTVISTPLELTVGASGLLDETLSLSFVNPPDAGSYVVEVVTPSGLVIPAARWRVVEAALDELRVANTARLDALAVDAALADAVRVARLRNTLLADEPDRDDTFARFIDPQVVIAELRSEIEALEAGVDPYLRRTGDYWRPIDTANGAMPARWFVPFNAVDAPAAVILALHGAGGDENLFMDAYGRGVLKPLAQQLGAIVVSGRTEPFLERVGVAEEVLSAIESDYAIDRGRIYIVGHSLGTIAAVTIDQRSPGLIARMALIAGGWNLGAAGEITTPTLVILGENDRTAEPPTIIESVQQAVGDHAAPIELRILPDYDHTLIVGDRLNEAAAFLGAVD